MKFIAGYLSVVFFAALVVSCMTQMTKGTHEATFARRLSQLFACAAFFNLFAAVAFCLEVDFSLTVFAFVGGNVAIAWLGFVRLRGASTATLEDTAAPTV